jgi:hypothetical protein
LFEIKSTGGQAVPAQKKKCSIDNPCDNICKIAPFSQILGTDPILVIMKPR